MVNRLCDMFIVTQNGTVQMLDLGSGTLTTVAESREDFARRIDEGNNANEWLAIPLIDQLVAAGVRLESGQCYGFKKPPILGGEFAIENIVPISICDYLAAYGSIHEQLKDLPEGTEVVLQIAGQPTAPEAISP